MHDGLYIDTSLQYMNSYRMINLLISNISHQSLLRIHCDGYVVIHHPWIYYTLDTSIHSTWLMILTQQSDDHNELGEL